MPIYKMDGRKDGKQQYRVRINYTDKNGVAKQIDRVAYGASEAKLLEAQLNREFKENTLIVRRTVQELYDEYIQNKSHDVRETTLEKSKQILRLHILPTMGAERIDKLSSTTLQKWKNSISDKKLSITTKQNIYKEFRALLNYAVKMEYLLKNPLGSVGNFKEVYFEMQQDKMHYYTVDQFKKYINTAKDKSLTITDWGYYVFFNIAFYTGMRKGEINALRWSDIENDIIHVRRSVAQKLKGGDRETPPKNKSSYRDLQAPAPLIKILQEQKERQQKDKRFTEEYRVCGGPVCLRDTSLSNKNIQFAKEANLPIIRIHDFRHSHVSLLANEGINIQEIARRLGHSKIETTWNTYAHLYPREEERAIKILNKIV